MTWRMNRALPAAAAALGMTIGSAAALAQPDVPREPDQPPGQQPQEPRREQPRVVPGGEPQAERPGASAEARQLLERVRQHYQNLQGVTVDMTMSTSMEMEGEEIKQEQPPLQLAAQRPNRVSLRMDEAEEAYALVSDGQTMWHYMGDILNAYTEEPAPATFGGLLDAASFGQDPEPSTLLMSPHGLVLALLDGQRFQQLINAATEVKLLEQEQRDGQAYQRVRIMMDDLDADLWIRAGEEPWLDRVVPDMSKMFKEMQEEMPEGTAGEQDFAPPEIEASFANWTRTQQFDPGTFAFTPPEDAAKVDSLMQAMQEKMRGEMGAAGEGGESNLLGKQAPALNLELLDGGKVDLATHQKKGEIVVLDFWATWCPPCVKGLPLVSSAADEFADQGVVFYAVNQREEPEKIREFLQKRDLDVKVPLDKEGEAGDRYGVQGIPQTVIIGKDGTVQAVHVGFAPGMEDQLREELKKLVAGEKLAEPQSGEEGDEAEPQDDGAGGSP